MSLLIAPSPEAHGKHRYYYKHLGDLKQRLGEAIPRQELRDLHRIRAWRHFVTVGRHLSMTALCGAALWQSRWPWLWLPAALLQGANILGYVVLLHEQVHKNIFATSRPRLERLLGLLYALPSSISATQFRIWHLEHHDELGHAEDDPKRAHLSPKKNSRWLKALYFTPALFAIYARGSSREMQRYTPGERRLIHAERLATLVVHAAFAVALWNLASPWVMFRVWFVPLFLCFPPAFVLNRLGQHYDIDPADPAKWSTRVDGNWAWRFLFLWANFHAEHHYYQRVPFYNLRRLNADLRGFYQRVGLRSHGYAQMLWGWFVENREAHTDWEEDVPRG